PVKEQHDVTVELTKEELRWLCGTLRGWCSDPCYSLDGQELVNRFKLLLNLEMERPGHTSTDSRVRAAYACAEFQREKEEDPFYLLSKKDDTGGLAVTSRHFFDDEAGGGWVNERNATRYATREEAETVLNRRFNPDVVSVVERNN